ncbi:MAG: TIGR00289 family protein [Euryarchaeota archaeon]|nr:TIGR00289 family protein [Euryarchaeota archaeon]
MKIATLFSGGKDSTMAVYKAIEAGNDVEYLVSMISDNPHSYMYHVPNIHLTQLSSEALEIPLIKGVTKGEKEKELEDLKLVLKELKQKKIVGIYSGAISSTYQKSRIDKICDELGFKSCTPLWHMDPKEYLKELIKLGFEVIITSVSAEGLDESWLGRKIDENLLDELTNLNEKYGIHMAFEGGEAETLVLNCPIFKKSIKIIKADKIWKKDSGFLSIKKAVLEEKAY